MPTITDHLAQAREHLTRADETPLTSSSSSIGAILNSLLCVVENLTEATDLLQQQNNQNRAAIEAIEHRETFTMHH